MRKASALQRMVIAVILGTAFGVIWGFGLAALSQLLPESEMTDYEEIVVDANGTAYVRVRVRGEYDNLQFRTLDGQSVERSERDTFFPTNLNGPYRPPRIAEYQIPWSNRIAGISGFERPPVSWVVLRNDNRPGRAYIVGHDPESNQPVGYIGRKGFRTSLPPRDDWFDVGDHTFQYDQNAFATTGNMSAGYLGSSYIPPALGGENVLQPWLIYLCDGNAIQEINLRTRGVRLVREFDRLVGIAVPASAEIDPRRRRDQQTESRLLVRTRDDFVLVDVFTGTEQRFKIPEEVKQMSLGVNPVGAEHLMLHAGRGRWERGNVTELLTINSVGEIQKRQTLQLIWGSQESPALFALIPAFLVPVLFVWLAGMFLIAPLVQLQEYRVAMFSEGISVAWNTAWMGLLVVIVLSIVLAAITYRWHQKFSRPNTALWMTFVFFTTLPGFLAYWVMHRREPMGVCRHCGSSIPLDRDMCAKCAAPLPEPKLLGTEIFA